MLFDVPVSVLSASALLALTVLMLLSGRIVPRSTLQDKVAETERWRQAYETEREARNISDAQTAELLEVARTTRAMIAAMASTSEQLRRGGTGAIQQETQ